MELSLDVKVSWGDAHGIPLIQLAKQLYLFVPIILKRYVWPLDAFGIIVRVIRYHLYLDSCSSLNVVKLQAMIQIYVIPLVALLVMYHVPRSIDVPIWLIKSYAIRLRPTLSHPNQTHKQCVHGIQLLIVVSTSHHAPQHLQAYVISYQTCARFKVTHVVPLHVETIITRFNQICIPIGCL